MNITTGPRRWAVAPISVGVVLLLLLGAIGAGLRVPGLSYLSGLPGFGGLDYRNLSAGSFLPLRAGYVDSLLGTNLAEGAPPRLDGPAGLLDRPGAVPALDSFRATPVVDAARPVVLDHEFTNDDMDSPVVISSLPFTARTDTTNATRQPGEPGDCAPAGGTAWYRYTPRRDGVLFADTFGSNHATAIGVFRSPSTGRPTQVACATDPAGAQVGFPVATGTTYLFQVAGIVGGGKLVFHLTMLGRTEKVSGPVDGRGSLDTAQGAAISGDGRYVAFESGSHDNTQVFVADRRSRTVTLVSRSSGGRPGTGESSNASLSYDGRYVGFASFASNLVPGDSNGDDDYFVHDRITGQTVRASVSSNGSEGTGNLNTLGPEDGHLSANGRFATFSTAEGGLVENDPPGSNDIFVRDLRLGLTTRESVDDDGNPAQAPSLAGQISKDGRYVAFLSRARNLAPAQYRNCVPQATVESNCYNVFLRDRRTGHVRLLSVNRSRQTDSEASRLAMSSDGQVVAWSSTSSVMDPHDTNGVSDVFAIDVRTGITRRVSVTSAGGQQNDPGGTGVTGIIPGPAATGRDLAVSADGSRIAFGSLSTNLVPGDNNGRSDVFVRDLAAGLTVRVSASSAGKESNGDSYRPAISADGRVVAFESDADNLAPPDTNRLTDIYAHDLGFGR